MVDIMTYMKMWYDEENWTDFNHAYSEGDDLYCAYLLVNSGAINSKLIKNGGAEFFKDEAYRLEKQIEKLAKQFDKMTDKKQNEYIKNLYKDVFIVACKDCNCTSFVNYQNETLYPEITVECWECGSKNINTKKS